MMKTNEHTFVVCAYGESPYLEECIHSLKEQNIPSEILMITSTPNKAIYQTAEKFQIPVFVNEGESGITQDWNFGYAQAKTEYVTIAHQDDVYMPEYTQRLLYTIKKSKTPLIFFSNYAEVRNGIVVKNNMLLRIKRIMLIPLQIKIFQKSKWIRRRILSLGSPICCPSVGYVKNNLPNKIFEKGFRSCEDWEAWEKISKLSGEFLYDSKILMYHRIHKDSETSSIIGDNARSAEEYQMYCKFWPKSIAKILVKQYAKGQKSNDLNS